MGLESWMVDTRTASTKERLLDAAEALFAVDGFEATNLRRITQQAEANLAAVHYHFGNKQGLIEAMFARRIEPLNTERLRQLETAMSGEPDLAAVLRAFAGPCFELMAGEDGHQVTRLMSRVMGDPALHRHLVERHFLPVIEAFSQALARCLPSRKAEEIRRIFIYLLGSMAHVLMTTQMMPEVFGRPGSRLDTAAAIDAYVRYHLAAIHHAEALA